MKARLNQKILSLALTLAMLCGLMMTSAAAVVAYDVTFTGEHQKTYIDGVEVEETVINNSFTTFETVADEGYTIVTVTPSLGYLTGNSDGSYTIRGVTSSSTVSIETSDYTGTWLDNADTSWYNTATEGEEVTYTLTTPKQLAGLSKLVSEGHTMANATIKLGADIDLQGHFWAPIGGSGLYVNSAMPGGYGFAGTFDGGYVNSDTENTLGTFEIKNMVIPWNIGGTMPNGTVIDSSTSYAGLGLFGYVDGGTIQNVTVSGRIGTNAATYCVGGIVGYLNGSAYNCHNKVDIVISNTTPAGCGGIAGVAENVNSEAVNFIQYCSNTAYVMGRGRVGGIAGAVYCVTDGGIVVDKCFNTGHIANNSSSNKAYTGGIVGYCRGYIQNCYSVATMTSHGGHYMAGLAGLLQGASPQAQLINSYTVPNIEKFNSTYDYFAFASTDSSTTMPIAGVMWDTSTTKNTIVYPIGQPDGTLAARWGFWTDSGAVSTEGLKGDGKVEVKSTDPDNSTSMIASTMTALEVLNGTNGLDVSGYTVKPGNAFTYVEGMNDGYPVLKWQVNGVSASDFGSGSGSEVVKQATVYLDGSAKAGGDGSEDKPYTTLEDALNGVEANGTIIVTGTSTISSALSWFGNVSIECADDFSGTMFVVDVPEDEYVRLTTMTITGNDNTTIFDVQSGALQLRNGITVEGGKVAVDVNGGALEVSRGTISASEYSVKVENADSSFVLSDNTASVSIPNTVYLGTGAYITLDDPVPCKLTIECEEQEGEVVIAQGTEDYQVQQSDCDMLTVENSSDLYIEDNQILANFF